MSSTGDRESGVLKLKVTCAIPVTTSVLAEADGMSMSEAIKPDEHYACCYVLFGTASHIRTTAERIDRELLAALMNAMHIIPAFLQSPTEELRMQMHFAIDKFDGQFADLDDSLSLRGLYDHGLAKYRERR